MVNIETRRTSRVGVDMKQGAKRKLTREEVAWVLELKSEGVKSAYIARYVYGISYKALYDRLKTWGAT